METIDKITSESDLDTWYGITKNGEKVAITEVSLLEFTSLLANAEDVEVSNKGKDLFEKAKTDFFIEMHDGTKLAKSLKAMVENGLEELAKELTEFAKETNLKNGYLDNNPWT